MLSGHKCQFLLALQCGGIANRDFPHLHQARLCTYRLPAVCIPPPPKSTLPLCSSPGARQHISGKTPFLGCSGQGQQLCTRILNHTAVPNNNQELRERGQLPKMKQDEERGLLLVSGPSIGNSGPASHTPPQPPSSFPLYRMTGCTSSCLVPFPFAN